ncbi:MAG: protein-disulfide reductase DsbD family protein [Marinagarivorans sp.]|nr:protein-disulfide reductase DsbD family protein [Marinagarivorans sp.]
MNLISKLSLLFVLATSAINVLANTTLVETKDDFLPVDQAYKVSVSSEDNNVYLDWDIASGYYLYKEKFKFFANTQDTRTKLTPALEAGQMKFDPYENRELEVFHNATRITLNSSDVGTQFELKLQSQGCADAGLCYAPRTQYFQIDTSTGSVTETKKATIPNNPNQKEIAQAGDISAPAVVIAEEETRSFWFYILLAIGGGMLLNLMPCVFPVLSLKALSFASHADGPHSHQAHGWAYTAGVVGSFIIVAIAIIALRQAGESAGWGFQLQSPLFVAAIMYLFLVMGLSLSGMIYFGTGLMGVGQGLTNSDGLKGSFFTGVLAAVVASPCTGPMMAPALGFALTQPWYTSIFIFIALGFGLAFPFLLLSYSPAVARALPAPGTWMEVLKQFLAFPMYITSAWLLYVFGNQVGMTGVFFLTLGGIAIVYAIWVFQHIPEKGTGKWIAKISGYAALICAGYIAYNGETFKKDPSWIPYTPTVVQELRSKGQPVFVDFTADWCITCKANEAVAIDRVEFRETVAELNYAKVKGDWTNEDPNITAVLTEYKRSGVPLYLVFPADMSKPAEVLPQLLTKEMVVDALKRNAPAQ